jgi:hypothetical protein
MGQEVYERGNGGTLMKKMQERSLSRNRSYLSIMKRFAPITRPCYCQKRTQFRTKWLDSASWAELKRREAHDSLSKGLLGREHANYRRS